MLSILQELLSAFLEWKVRLLQYDKVEKRNEKDKT